MWSTHQLATGKLLHWRFARPAHRFSYGMRLLLLDLHDMPKLTKQTRFWSTEKPALAGIYRRDYLDKPEIPLLKRVRELVSEKLNRDFNGKCFLLTAPRILGLSFNPLSLFFCFDHDGEKPSAIVAEVHNTPWFERHVYVLDFECVQTGHAEHPKTFHVSPFLPMDISYQWTCELGADRIFVQIANSRAGESVFKAVLTLNLKSLSARTMDREIWRHRPQAWATVFGIYWQALKLVFKRAPFYGHSKTQGQA